VCADDHQNWKNPQIHDACRQLPANHNRTKNRVLFLPRILRAFWKAAFFEDSVDAYLQDTSLAKSCPPSSFTDEVAEFLYGAVHRQLVPLRCRKTIFQFLERIKVPVLHSRQAYTVMSHSLADTSATFGDYHRDSTGSRSSTACGKWSTYCRASLCWSRWK